jgi:hypothetical protein
MQNNPYWLPWQQAAQQLGVSAHPNQLAKRQAKYPEHFVYDSEQDYISIVLYEALKEYRQALSYLETLRKGGGYE